jgi:hypothetical protein
VFVDDIDNNLHSVIYKYADDMKLVARLSREASIVDSAVLQRDLDIVENWASTWLLSFNVDKCSCLNFGSNNPQHDYSLFGTRLPCVDEASDLGILMSSTLSFSPHCAKIASRADRMIHVVRRSIKNLTKMSLLSIHRAVVRPLVEYATVVYCPYYVGDINRIEGVQRRMTKLLPEIRELSYHERLAFLNLQTLAQRRERSDLITVWKIVHGRLDLEITDLFELPADGRTRGHSCKLDTKDIPRKICRRHFFPFRIVRLWNSLPETIVQQRTVSGFKRSLHCVGGPYFTGD